MTNQTPSKPVDQSIAENLWWVIPGKLAGVRKPTAALNSKSGRDVVGIMQQLVKEQGCAVLMVTHDNRILDIADRIVHMEDGQFMHSRVAHK